LGSWFIGIEKQELAGQIPATVVAGGEGKLAREDQGIRGNLAGGDVQVGEMNRIPESRNPTPCIVVIVPGSSAITYRTHFKHNTTVILIKRSTTGLIIT
jgi:hypothetical protein